jgi:hypothetical protein
MAIELVARGDAFHYDWIIVMRPPNRFNRGRPAYEHAARTQTGCAQAKEERQK